MKLSEALHKLRQASSRPVTARIELLCGFEALHLGSFLRAHYLVGSRRDDGGTLDVATGTYGDLLGNITRAAVSAADAAAVVLEWSDLDPRLSARSVGPWSGHRQGDIIDGVKTRLSALSQGVTQLAARMRCVVCPPTLPLLLGSSTPLAQASEFELHLQHELCEFLVAVSKESLVRVLSSSELSYVSPVSLRHDPRSELSTGFPYRLPHASALAAQLIALLFPRTPMKGLITDLDDTLWRGIVGEVSAAGLAWSQADGAQVHGLYQSQLQQLTEMGVLLGVASKNDVESANAGLARDDLQLDSTRLFPVCASWDDKRHAIAQCLATWNISADAVVFVDDSQLELDLARAAFPELTCLRFDAQDPAAVLQLLRQLRMLFGRDVVSPEDELRSASIRASAAFQADLDQSFDSKDLLRQVGGELTLSYDTDVDALRGLQLLNKTNQFNLNGERLNETQWESYLTEPSRFALAAAYRDKYGSLGNVGVMAGTREADALVVRHWVLSCRALSRQLEHHMLHAVGQLAPDLPVRLAFVRTQKNAPLKGFLESLGLDLNSRGPLELSPDVLSRALDGELPHTVRCSSGSAAGQRSIDE